MICKILFDLLLAASWWSGLGMDLDRPVADAYFPCDTPACLCPKDSPCRKDCCKDACTCKGATCPVGFVDSGVCGLPAVCEMPMLPMPAAPGAFAAPRLYEVHLKVGKQDCPKLMLSAGQTAVVAVACAEGKGRHIGIKLGEDCGGCLPVRVCLEEVALGCGGFPSPVSAHRGEKKVHFDTMTNLVMSGDDPEPKCAQVMIKSIDAQTWNPAPPAVCMPCMPPMPCPAPGVCLPCPQVPTWAGPMPAPCMSPPANVVQCAPPMPPAPCVPPMPTSAPRACLPEPMPLAHPAVCNLERCAARVPATKECSSARFEVLRQVYPAEKSVLSVKGEGISATAVRMTIAKGECGPLTVAAGKNLVHVKGKTWKAQADSVEILSDGRVVLTGHVKLMCDKLGVCASVKARKLCVQVKDGKFEKIVDR